jgi:ABC-2 type transport system ATP-binding protein
MAIPPILEIDNLGKRFAGAGLIPWLLSAGRARRHTVAALADVSLHVSPGEIVAVLGSPGSGRSTLLRCAAGIVAATSGCVRVLGEDPARITTPLRGEIGFASRFDQSMRDALSVHENLQFYGRLQAISADELPARVDAALVMTDIVGAAHLAFGDLPTSIRRRVHLARALLGRPSLLLVDELTAGVDTSDRDAIYTVISRQVDTRNIGVLWSTNDLTEAQYFCNRTIVLDEGRVASRGDWLEVEATVEALMRRDDSEWTP